MFFRKCRALFVLTLFFVSINLALQVNPTRLSTIVDKESPAAFAEKQKVSPNPDVYPGFYKKDDQINNSRMMMQASMKDFSAEKSAEAFKSPLNSGNTEKVLVIPVQFTDVVFDPGRDQAHFQEIMDSMKDYYEKNSGYVPGIKGITIDYTVAQTVTSAHTMSYYGSDGLKLGDDEKNGPVYEMAREAVKLLDPAFDFSLFDNDQDGAIDHLIIIHAGDGQENVNNTDNIWSHRWIIGDGGTFAQNTDPDDNYRDGESVDGIYAYNYACVPETGTLGVFAHEFGHDLGLPDLYDTDGAANGLTMGAGNWDIMGSGSWNCLPGDEAGTCPANLSVWSKEFLGWITPVDITADGSYTLENSIINNQAFRLWTDGITDGNEYFLAEYRRKNGYDAGLPGEGILVWHVDVQQILAAFNLNEINADRSRPGLSLEQADGKNDLLNCSNRGDDGDPYPGSTGNMNFCRMPSGLNDSNIAPWDYSYVDINNINVEDNTAAANYYVIKSCVKNTPSINMPANNSIIGIQPTFSWNIVPQASAYKLQIAGDSGFTSELKEITIDTGTPGVDYFENALIYSLPYDMRLPYAGTYYWRVSGLNPQNTASDLAWSEVRSFKTVDESGLFLQTPVNIKPAQMDDQIILTWDEVAAATGYYIIADGTEFYTGTNSFRHDLLLTNSMHRYRVRAVNGQTSSSWSDLLEVATTGAPVITTESFNLSEGREDGASIIVHLANGEFKANAIYNKATVMLDPADLPAGVRQGEVVRKDAVSLEIGLVGNSMADYNGRKYVTLAIAKELITTGGCDDSTAEVLFDDTQQVSEAISAAALLDNTFAEGEEDGRQIIITLNNGQFIDTIDQTKFSTTGLPAGVNICTVVKNDNYSATITLSGNSTVDYDTDLNVNIIIEKSQIQTAQADIFCMVVLPAIVEQQPSAPENISFSFSAPNAGRLMGITLEMEYSLDGGHNFISAAENDHALSENEISSITDINNIYIRKKAIFREPFSFPYLIDIQTGAAVISVMADDSKNTVSGINNLMEFSMDGVNWTRFNDALPDLSGNVTLSIRYAASGIFLAGPVTKLTFTAEVIPAPVQPAGPSGGGIVIPVMPAAAVPAEITCAGGQFTLDDLRSQINDAKNNNVSVLLPQTPKSHTVAIEAGVFNQLDSMKKNLIIKGSGIIIKMPPCAISGEDLKNAGENAWVKVSMEKVDMTKLDQPLKDALQDASKEYFAFTGRMFNLGLLIVTSDKIQRISGFKEDVSITVDLSGTGISSSKADKLGVYYFNETAKQWEYIGGAYNKETDSITFTTPHFSIFSVMLYDRTFKDIEKHWARNDIENMVSRHVIKGVGKDSFDPEGTITRAEFVAMLVRSMGIGSGTAGNMPYTDVGKDKWFFPEINMAVKSGIASSEDGVMFRPDASITREEMAVMLGRALKMKLKNITMTESQIKEKLSMFKDSSEISAAAKESVAIAVDKKIILGHPGPVFAPGATAKRAEAAVMMKRLLDVIQ